MAPTTREDGERRWTWTPVVIRILVALLVATPFIAIILQAIGKK